MKGKSKFNIFNTISIWIVMLCFLLSIGQKAFNFNTDSATIGQKKDTLTAKYTSNLAFSEVVEYEQASEIEEEEEEAEEDKHYGFDLFSKVNFIFGKANNSLSFAVIKRDSKQLPFYLLFKQLKINLI
jgi:hypothetical protein